MVLGFPVEGSHGGGPGESHAGTDAVWRDHSEAWDVLGAALTISSEELSHKGIDSHSFAPLLQSLFKTVTVRKADPFFQNSSFEAGSGGARL